MNKRESDESKRLRNVLSSWAVISVNLLKHLVAIATTRYVSATGNILPALQT